MTINFDTLKASLLLYGLNGLYAIALLFCGWYLSGVAQRFVMKVTTVARKVDPLVTIFAASLARYAVMAVVGIAVLQLFGIQTASLVAVLGATSLAIGLALQGTLSNLAAGVMLLLFRPFHIGDDVEVAGKAGKVKSMSLFMTELLAADNTQILLPNGSVWGTAIINHSTYPGTGELKVSFPVPAGDMAKRVGDDVLAALRGDPRLDATVEPAVHVSKVVDVSDPAKAVVELTVSAQVKPADTDAVKQTLLARVSSILSAKPERLAESTAA